MTAAVLNQVVEDCEGWSLERLRGEGFSEVVVEAVDCLTSREGETYDEFLKRVENNPIAIQVKIADLEDNMDVRRIERLGERDLARIDKYLNVWHSLKAKVINS